MAKVNTTDLNYKSIKEPPYERVDKYAKANARGKIVAYIWLFFGVCACFNYCAMILPIQRQASEIKQQMTDTTVIMFYGFNESGNLVQYPAPRNKTLPNP